MTERPISAVIEHAGRDDSSALRIAADYADMVIGQPNVDPVTMENARQAVVRAEGALQRISAAVSRQRSITGGYENP